MCLYEMEGAPEISGVRTVNFVEPVEWEMKAFQAVNDK